MSIETAWLPDSWQLPLQKQVVGLVVETPLADGQRGPGLLDLCHHLVKLLGLVLPQVAVVLDAGHVQLVLRLRLWRLERAGQDGDLHVTEFLEQQISRLRKSTNSFSY